VRLPSGFEEEQKRAELPILPSGDRTFDELLGGGFRKDFVYLLYGDKKTLSDILLTTIVTSYRDQDYSQKVAFVDAVNRFNPYHISKLAVSHRLSPSKVLESILISRAFTWHQVVELLENRLSQLENIKIVMISGITQLWPNYEQTSFQELLMAINGVKQTLHKLDPLLIITAPLNPHSTFKPVGGHNLTHFGQVLVLITSEERYDEYQLIQHPSRPEIILKRHHPPPKKRKKHNEWHLIRNTTLDDWF
jgi:hypothetical protein